jgi:hypothetical protein
MLFYSLGLGLLQHDCHPAKNYETRDHSAGLSFDPLTASWKSGTNCPGKDPAELNDADATRDSSV